uniref:Uncharacterized protein n=1 Tax=Spironucleus salmonicida TaxID=348837 RepID=V6LWP3_9EUKA|eukprot:EST49062.1 Hypothetical protein SS50377_10664 [Spironucleus salmonicida]
MDALPTKCAPQQVLRPTLLLQIDRTWALIYFLCHYTWREGYLPQSIVDYARLPGSSLLQTRGRINNSNHRIPHMMVARQTPPPNGWQSSVPPFGSASGRQIESTASVYGCKISAYYYFGVVERLGRVLQIVTQHDVRKVPMPQNQHSILPVHFF